MTKVAVAVVVLLGGGVAAFCVVALHQLWWGLVLGLAATGAALVALPGGWWGRFPFALGWTGAVGVLTPQRPEGDYLIAADPHGYVLLVAALLTFVAGLVGLRPPPPRGKETGPLGDTDPAVRASSS